MVLQESYSVTWILGPQITVAITWEVHIALRWGDRSQLNRGGESEMEMYKIVMGAGLLLVAAMVILMRIGTTSLLLFIAWGVLALVGGAITMMGQKMRDRR